MSTAEIKQSTCFLSCLGMGVPTVTAARILKGQLSGQSGEETQLEMDKFPFVSLAKVSLGYYFTQYRTMYWFLLSAERMWPRTRSLSVSCPGCVLQYVTRDIEDQFHYYLCSFYVWHTTSAAAAQHVSVNRQVWQYSRCMKRPGACSTYLASLSPTSAVLDARYHGAGFSSLATSKFELQLNS